jgi:uncharacterized damage-inducible protein DinB
VNSRLVNSSLETDELYQQMFEANFANWESVKSVQHITGPRSERLMAHILETKRMYWKIIAKACKLPAAPSGLLDGALEEVMNYELEQIAGMDAATRATPLKYGSQRMTAASLIRLAARHSVWHAGQIALTKFE